MNELRTCAQVAADNSVTSTDCFAPIESPGLAARLRTAAATLHKDLHRDAHPAAFAVIDIARRAYLTGPGQGNLPSDLVTAWEPRIPGVAVAKELYARRAALNEESAKWSPDAAKAAYDAARAELRANPRHEHVRTLEQYKIDFRTHLAALWGQFEDECKATLPALRLEVCNVLLPLLEEMLIDRLRAEQSDADNFSIPYTPSCTCWALAALVDFVHRERLKMIEWEHNPAARRADFGIIAAVIDALNRPTT